MVAVVREDDMVGGMMGEQELLGIGVFEALCFFSKRILEDRCPQLLVGVLSFFDKKFSMSVINQLHLCDITLKICNGYFCFL